MGTVGSKKAFVRWRKPLTETPHKDLSVCHFIIKSKRVGENYQNSASPKEVNILQVKSVSGIGVNRSDGCLSSACTWRLQRPVREAGRIEQGKERRMHLMIALHELGPDPGYQFIAGFSPSHPRM
jgi:hypothetical protein